MAVCWPPRASTSSTPSWYLTKPRRLLRCHVRATLFALALALALFALALALALALASLCS